MDEGQKAEIEHALAEAGVPAHVVSYVFGFDLSRWLYIATQALLLPIMIGGFAFGAFVLWPPLERTTEENARQHALAADALLYHTNFGVSLLIALFGWIFITGAIVGVLTALTPRLRALTFVYSVLESRRRWIARESVRRSLAALADEQDAPSYVARATTGWVRATAYAGLILAATSALAVERDVNAHSLFTRTEYLRSPFLPWAAATSRAWRDAERVELGCNHVTGRNASDDVIYKVAFADGATVDIASGRPVPGGDWLAAAEAIDTQLRASGAAFQRWRRLERDPLHPACLAVMRRGFAGDYPRLERLLRIGDFAGDR